ncbi:hypothetical protein GN244_ATG15944 [Phytophthora infestans]|uniref:Uncharacterized protein n=1 Tax=Phytophthora infestans TaxID=4787 RepID=A0A833SUH8_PHYIN|nr:hypothetical protein GN244_ATG15944 [Phytophthora infestans]KAF4131141.1 hypothetical protein GN958_ATG19686 [Phytophthora infestans]
MSLSIQLRACALSLRYANLQHDEELALLRFGLDRELEDVWMVSALAAICADLGYCSGSLKVMSFTPLLMTMKDDIERITWLQGHEQLDDANGNIVGAVLIDGNHWRALGIKIQT